MFVGLAMSCQNVMSVFFIGWILHHVNKAWPAVQCRPPTRPARRRPTGHAPGPSARRLPAGSVTDDDRRPRAKQYWPIRRASNNISNVWCHRHGKPLWKFTQYADSAPDGGQPSDEANRFGLWSIRRHLPVCVDMNVNCMYFDRPLSCRIWPQSPKKLEPPKKTASRKSAEIKKFGVPIPAFQVTISLISGGSKGGGVARPPVKRLPPCNPQVNFMMHEYRMLPELGATV